MILGGRSGKVAEKDEAKEFSAGTRIRERNKGSHCYCFSLPEAERKTRLVKLSLVVEKEKSLWAGREGHLQLPGRQWPLW